MTLSSFLTTARKSWVGALVATVATPVLETLISGHFDGTTLLTSAIGGLLTGLGVYQARNDRSDAELAVQQALVAKAVADALVLARQSIPVPVQRTIAAAAEQTNHLLEEATKDFGGQSVGE